MKKLLFALLLALPCLVRAGEDPAVAVSAAQYHQLIREVRAHAVVPSDSTLDRLLAVGKAERLFHEKRWDEAIAEYETLIAGGDNKASIWLRLSRAWDQKEQTRETAERALQAAYNAYRMARDADERSLALFQLGSAYESLERPMKAMAAYKEGLALKDSAEYAERYKRLAEIHAFRLSSVDVKSDAAIPRVCLIFSAPLRRGSRIRYEDYLSIEPVITPVLSVRDRSLCVEGVVHGQTYQITVRSGLPSVSGEETLKVESVEVQVSDRKPAVGFLGDAYVLPSAMPELPLLTVNVAAVRLQVLLINDRNLVQQINDGLITSALSVDAVERIAEQFGELLWKGEVLIQGERNQEIVTAIPFAKIVQATQPGVYVVTAEPTGQAYPRNQNLATQWLVVSDLGLSTLQGEEGLHVFVRSLQSARPLKGVELRLYARNNSELVSVVSDRNGYAQVSPGRLRGSGGREPAVLMAYGKNGDFNFLDLTQSALDLDDHGVAGRAMPGPLDAFLYARSGVYRPGDSVELTALLRDSRGYAVEGVPLILKLLRPDGLEMNTLTLSESSLGGYSARLPLAANADTGLWQVRAYVNPDDEPVGLLSFKVQESAHQVLELELDTPTEVLQPGSTAEVTVTARFSYGAAAAYLKAEAELMLREEPNPYPDYPGYRFGMADDEWRAQTQPLPIVGTDAEGQTRTAVRLDETPNTTRPLQAVVRISLFELGNRTVTSSLKIPYRSRPLTIGIRPRFDGESIEMGQEGVFEIIALNPFGGREAVAGLRYELIREQSDDYWAHHDQHWDHKSMVREGESVANGSIAVSADEPYALVQSGLSRGRYRLEVYDPETGAASSMRFGVGWFADSDALQLSLDKAYYRVGETARVHIQAPFAGEALLTVASDRLWTLRTFNLPEDGITLELPVAEDWAPGVYVMASAFRPAGEAGRGPGRAFGVVWLNLDPAPRILNVSIDAPLQARPRQTIEVPVAITGGRPEQPVYLTLTAVDENSFRLSGFAVPDPIQYYLGKRRLGVEFLDLYDSLIQAAGQSGRLPFGGDAGSQDLDANDDRQSLASTALFSGIVALDKEGRASIPLDLPDFEGRLQLMAVAWDRSRLGRAQAALLVRDPVQIQFHLPSFLTPNDAAQSLLEIRGLGAAPGDYQVRLQAEGAVALDKQDGDFDYRVEAANTRFEERRSYTLHALKAGAGKLNLQLNGPDGFSVARVWEIEVRSAQAVVSESEILRIEAGESITLGNKPLQSFVSGTQRLRFSLSTQTVLDIAGLLARLERYPYGCLEQRVSRAAPLMYFKWVEAGGAAENADLRRQVQDAIQNIFSLQRTDGGFGLWSPDNPPESWLSAYALDFLTRAREQGYAVSEAPYRRGLGWLEKDLVANNLDSAELISRVYALYVLTRAGWATIEDLRDLHDAYLERLPTVLARAQLGSALARAGDPERARAAFMAAMNIDSEREEEMSDYGSALRDQAALLALLAEAGIMPDRIPQLGEALAADTARKNFISTQEQAWLLLAARGLIGKGREALELTIDGKPASMDLDPLLLSREDPERGLAISNLSDKPIWCVVNRSGAPAAVQPPVQQGFRIARRFYTRTGEIVDPNQVRRNELLVVVISGEALTDAKRQALIVDLLPAGLKIENVHLFENAARNEFAWLPKLSEVMHTEFRDDRFVAAVKLDREQRTFATAYLVRAVTPGSYTLPAVLVEDMYQPRYRAQGPLESMRIE